MKRSEPEQAINHDTNYFVICSLLYLCVWFDVSATSIGNELYYPYAACRDKTDWKPSHKKELKHWLIEWVCVSWGISPFFVEYCSAVHSKIDDAFKFYNAYVLSVNGARNIFVKKYLIMERRQMTKVTHKDCVVFVCVHVSLSSDALHRVTEKKFYVSFCRRLAAYWSGHLKKKKEKNSGAVHVPDYFIKWLPILISWR